MSSSGHRSLKEILGLKGHLKTSHKVFCEFFSKSPLSEWSIGTPLVSPPVNQAAWTA